jgi:hypothetical protein
VIALLISSYRRVCSTARFTEAELSTTGGRGFAARSETRLGTTVPFSVLLCQGELTMWHNRTVNGTVVPMHTSLKTTDTYRRRLREVARDHHGYVTSKMAAEVGVPSVELRKMASRGGLTNVAYGVYRFDDLADGEHGQFMEAVLRAGDDAYLAGDAVLALHGLGLVNPRRIRVGTPRRVRAHLPPYINLVKREVAPDDLTLYEGIPSQTVARALIDSVGVVMRDRLLAAFHKAREEGLVRESETQEVLTAIEGWT